MVFPGLGEQSRVLVVSALCLTPSLFGVLPGVVGLPGCVPRATPAMPGFLLAAAALPPLPSWLPGVAARVPSL